MSSNGQWFGGSATLSGGSDGVVYDGRSLCLLGIEDAAVASVEDVNDHGMATGVFSHDRNDYTHGFVHDGHALHVLPELGPGGDVIPIAINNAGQAVGIASGSRGDASGFLWGAGVRQELPGFLSVDINDRGWMVGFQGALYRDGVVHVLNGLLGAGDRAHWNLNSARFINNAGQIVGMGAFEAWRWNEAAAHWSVIPEQVPDDGPSRFYISRARRHAAEPPPANWYALVRMTAK